MATLAQTEKLNYNVSQRREGGLVRYNARVRLDIKGIEIAPEVLRRELKVHAKQMGAILQARVREVQRVDTGRERRATKVRVRGGYSSSLVLSVYNDIVQGLVDETGAVKHFPPWRRGSSLFRWVERKGMGPAAIPKGGARAFNQANGRGAAKKYRDSRIDEIERISLRIARRQAGLIPGKRGGLPRPGDRLREPFKTTAKAQRNYIYNSWGEPVDRAISFINSQPNTPGGGK